MLQTDLSTIITYNPWAITADVTCRELLEYVAGADFHHWPVVDDDRRLVGMISNTDIVRAFESRAQAVAASEVGWDELLECSVANIMSHRVVTIVSGEYLANVTKLFREHGFHALPVVEQGRLIGLITTSDLMREFWYSDLPSGRDNVMDRMEAAGEPVDCDATIDEAAIAMQMASRDFISVVRGDLPIGVVSRRDLLMAKLRETVALNLSDTDIIEGPRTILELAVSAPTVRPGERLSNTAGRMVEHRRQLVAVQNQAGRLLGVVTEDAILRAMLESLQ